jgi:adenine-specific DNA-methyltransferase
MDVQYLSSRHDFLFVYAKSIADASLRRIEVGDLPKHYNKRDKRGRAYYLKPLRAMGGDDRR